MAVSRASEILKTETESRRFDCARSRESRFRQAEYLWCYNFETAGHKDLRNWREAIILELRIITRRAIWFALSGILRAGIARGDQFRGCVVDHGSPQFPSFLWCHMPSAMIQFNVALFFALVTLLCFSSAAVNPTPAAHKAESKQRPARQASWDDVRSVIYGLPESFQPDSLATAVLEGARANSVLFFCLCCPSESINLGSPFPHYAVQIHSLVNLTQLIRRLRLARSPEHAGELLELVCAPFSTRRFFLNFP